MKDSLKYFFIIVLVGLSFCVHAQNESPTKRNIIQLTGVVFAPDSNSVIPGVHVYIPKGGRGTTTNPYGFFSLPVLEGDSLIFSSVGFKRRHYIVPEHRKTTSLKLLITMEEDITFLNEVEVFPFPTEAMFKEAILSMEFPDQRKYNNLNAWLSSDYMNSAYADLPAGPNANHQYFMQMQMQAIQNRYSRPANNLLNPWAWSRFINDLKKGN